MRHLTPAQAAAGFGAGSLPNSSFEASHEGQPTVKWLSVKPVRDGGFVVTAHHVYLPVAVVDRGA